MTRGCLFIKMKEEVAEGGMVSGRWGGGCERLGIRQKDHLHEALKWMSLQMLSLKDKTIETV